MARSVLGLGGYPLPALDIGAAVVDCRDGGVAHVSRALHAALGEDGGLRRQDECSIFHAESLGCARRLVYLAGRPRTDQFGPQIALRFVPSIRGMHNRAMRPMPLHRKQ
jgi:hypothetical protein